MKYIILLFSIMLLSCQSQPVTAVPLNQLHNLVYETNNCSLFIANF